MATSKLEPQVENIFQVWPRLVAVIAAVGSVCAYVVSNWTDVEPILSSPAIVLMAMLCIFGLGGLATYWLVARPLEHRLGKAEGVINRLRDDERIIRAEMTKLQVQLARHETTLEMMLNPAPKLSTKRAKPKQAEE